ncbi:hypothetical protein, partial [Mesorhizobium sp. M4A.F.Ca.ET.020.02.1.1]|uniref:hypothetical protein n=1 Tax=Mesorhizobium sp. M4A.F.Ca.ET.020.02.1.1 TaxID=2496652 RepID=UPI001AECB914
MFSGKHCRGASVGNSNDLDNLLFTGSSRPEFSFKPSWAAGNVLEQEMTNHMSARRPRLFALLGATLALMPAAAIGGGVDVQTTSAAPIPPLAYQG